MLKARLKRTPGLLVPFRVSRVRYPEHNSHYPLGLMRFRKSGRYCVKHKSCHVADDEGDIRWVQTCIWCVYSQVGRINIPVVEDKTVPWPAGDCIGIERLGLSNKTDSFSLKIEIASGKFWIQKYWRLIFAVTVLFVFLSSNTESIQSSCGCGPFSPKEHSFW